MLATVAQFLAAHAIAMFVLSVALRTDRSVLRDLRRNWRLVLRALLAVWVAVPLLALVVLLLVQPPGMHAAILMVLAICPGVPLVLRRARKEHGDPRTSLLVLVATALAAVVMVPLWAEILNRATPLELAIRPRDVLEVLVPTLLLPFGLGRIVNALSPRVAAKLATVAQVLFVAGLAVILVAVIRNAGALRDLTARDVIAIVIITLGAAAIGYVAAADTLERRISVGYAAALGNPALALSVIALSYHVRALTLVVAFVVIRALALIPFSLWLKHRYEAATHAA